MSSANSRWLPVIALAAVMAACGTTEVREEEPGEVRHAPRSAPREPSRPGEELPPAPKSIPPDAARSAEDISGPAVQSLMGDARTALSANHPDQALPLLERALRIEPRNPFVLQMLAKTHLALGHPEDAEGFAEKSNSVAHSNPYVQVENWKVIAQTRQAAGDASGAERAQSRVDELTRLLGQ
ncbi:MAG TPA: tetratricopeptide repeat protein [Nevskiaceae bacterium]|nr:tetratricopeptide repeat protein [Nevskiaceae bacterium]